MQLIVSSRDALVRKLQVVSNIVEKRNTLPVLANVLIRKQGQRVELVSTDVEMQISTDAEMGVGADTVATTVGARKLLDILRSLPDGVDVSLKQDARKITVTGGKSRFSLQTLPAEDFPLVQEPSEWLVSLSLTQGLLKQLLSNVHFAMAQQDLRYYLNGVLLVIESGQVSAVATDGHRMAYSNVQTEVQSGLAAQQVIIPRKTVLELLRLLSDNDDPLSIELASNQARFSFSEIRLISKLVEGKFPDYQRVIPKQQNHVVLIEREVFLRSLQRASILTTDKFRGVRCIFNQGLMTVSASNSDQEEASDEIEVSYSGEAIDIGFNVTYLQDVLNNLKTEQIRLVLSDGNSSALVTKPEGDDFKYVVMPMRI